MLIKLAFKNIRYYTESYFVYIMTTAFSVWVYYTFLSFVGGDPLQSLSNSRTYRTCFSIGAWMILIFTALFIRYSTEFFFLKRKQEFGMYLLLGIRKRTICILLFVETVIMGMTAVICGLLAGTLTCTTVQALLSLLLNENGRFLTRLSLIDTGLLLLKFLILFILLGIINTSALRKSQLIDLFQAKDANELPIKVTRLRLTVVFAVLITGYVLIFHVKSSSNVHLLPLGIGFVLLGTYLLFTFGTPMLAGRLRTSNVCARDFSARVIITGMLHSVRGITLYWTAVSLLIAASMSIVTTAYCFYQTAQASFSDISALTASDHEIMNIFSILVFVLMLACASFLASTGSILYFKILSDIQENSCSYRLLFCLGASKTELFQTVKRQSFTMFAVPYAVGSLHTFMFSLYIHKRNLLQNTAPILISITAYALIYLFYFLLTVKRSKNLLKNSCSRSI